MKTGWKTLRLDEVCNIARGGSPRPIKDFITTDDNGLSWIKIGDTVLGGRYITETKQKIRPEGLKKSRFVKAGSFLLSNSMSFGRPYILKIDGCIHDGWLVLEPNYEIIDQDYLYHVLSSRLVFDQFNVLAAGSTVRNLNISLASKVNLPIPSLDEQKRIVTILDEAFTGLDRARAHTEANSQNAKDLFYSGLENSYSKEHGNRTTLRKLIKISHGFAFKSSQFEANGNTDLPVVLTPGNYTEDARIVTRRSKTKRLLGKIPQEHLFQVGELTIVMTDLSSKMKILGKPAFIEEPNILHNQRIGRVRFLANKISKEFLFYFLRTRYARDSIKNTATGTMIRHTAPTRILDLEISFPTDLNEQKELTSSLQKLESEIADITTSYQSKLTDLDDLRQSLLQKAFAGELT